MSTCSYSLVITTLHRNTIIIIVIDVIYIPNNGIMFANGVLIVVNIKEFRVRDIEVMAIRGVDDGKVIKALCVEV